MICEKVGAAGKRFQGGRGGLSGHARVGRHREWRRTHLGGSPLSAPQQREGRVFMRSRAPWWAAEVPRCAVRAVKAEFGRIHVLRILDPVSEPAAPVEAARTAAGHTDHRISQPLGCFGLLGVVSSHTLRVRPAPADGSDLSADFCPRLVLADTDRGAIRNHAAALVPRDAAAVPEHHDRTTDRALRRIAGRSGGGRRGQSSRARSRRRNEHSRTVEARASTLIRENTETNWSNPQYAQRDSELAPIEGLS